MFNTTCLGLAQHYANTLYDMSLVILPTDDDSELHEVMSLIPEDVLDVIDDPDNVQLISDHLEVLSNSLDPIVDDWTTALENTIKVLSSTVAPLYVDYLESAQAKLQEIEIPNESALYSVNIVDVPDWFLYDEAWFKDQNRSTLPVFNSLPSLRYDPLNDPNLKSILKSSISRYDTTAWLERTMASPLKATSAVFDGKGSSVYLTSLFASQDIFSRINDATMCILLTKLMEDSPPEALQINVNEYRMYLRNVRLLAQANITRALPLLRVYNTTNRLIINSDLDKHIIYVYGTVYREHYLTKGGITDALLGRLISRDTTSSSTDILANIKAYMEVWNNFVNNSRVINKRAYITHVKRVLRWMVDQMRLSAYEASTYRMEEGDFLPSEIKQDMFSIIDKITIADLDTIDMLAAKIIGMGRFSQLGAYDFITDMIECKLTCASHDSRSALFVAVTNHIATYIASKIKVQPIIRR